MENILERQLISAAQILEQQVDEKINELDHMDEDDYDRLRKKRLENLKQAQKQKQDWLQNGHGSYDEISNEKEFFEASKKSKNVVCHFYRDSNIYCKVVDKHLSLLAQKHLEARFIKINAEKCNFIVERLRIKIIPTICLIKDGKSVDYISGLSDFGGREDFPTEMMEWRIACSGIIDYAGDLTTPPVQGKPKKQSNKNKIIRNGANNRDSDEDSDD